LEVEDLDDVGPNQPFFLGRVRTVPISILDLVPVGLDDQRFASCLQFRASSWSQSTHH
jgi:hypothetical protein